MSDQKVTRFSGGARVDIDNPKTLPSTVVEPAAVSLFVFIYYALRTHWRTIAYSVGTGAVLALLVGFLSTPAFEASLTFTSADQPVDAGSGLSALASKVTGGALGGMSNFSPSIMDTIAVLNSREVTDAFIKKYNLLPELYPDKWDTELHKWKPPNFFDRFVQWVSGESDQQSDSGAPSMAGAVILFDKHRVVAISRDDGVVVLTVSWTDPQTAARWANELVRFTDESLRKRDMKESSKGLDFLQNQASRDKLAAMKDAIFEVAQQEMRMSMLANVRSEYALKVLDPAYPPLVRSWPARKFLLIVGLLGGLLVGSGIAIGWEYVRALRRHIMVGSIDL